MPAAISGGVDISEFSGWATYVTTDEFPVKVIKVNSKIEVL